MSDVDHASSPSPAEPPGAGRPTSARSGGARWSSTRPSSSSSNTATRAPRWRRSRVPPASPSRSSTRATPPRRSSSRRCCPARRSGSSPRSPPRCPTRPRATSRRALTGGLTAFLRAVEASPEAYRVVFLGEGANAAVARRIQRGRERQVEAVAMLARPLLGDGDDPAARPLGAAGRPRHRRPRRGRGPGAAQRARLDPRDARREARPDGRRRQRRAGVSAAAMRRGRSRRCGSSSPSSR